MADETRYPFRLNNAFFTTLHFNRPANLPESYEVVVKAEIRIWYEQLPERLQIELRVSSIEDQPLSFSVNLMALFDKVEGLPEPNVGMIPDFIDDRAMHMLWPYIIQLIRNVTGQMGTKPINLPTPHSYMLGSKLKLPETSEDPED